MSNAILPIAELRIDEPQVRVASPDGRTALDSVIGLDAIRARARLRFGPGRTCEQIARLLDRAIVQAEQAGLSPERLIIAGGRVQPGEDIVRVRRKAHGQADWISSSTSQVQISLEPAGLRAAAAVPTGPPPSTPQPVRPPAPGGHSAATSPGDERASAVRAALLDVIDPDLGVNVVDLGFVRGIEMHGRSAVITMTLTSAACPLTSIMEDQIRTGLDGVEGVDDFRIDWVWLPAWRPADMTASGRDQLRAIGFSF
jgi:metal-sulfur cluster biosynthetic enzyme